MSLFLSKLAEMLERLQLRGSRIVVGVSGGADSVALLCGLEQLASASKLDLHAAHLNHGLRPGQAEEDAEWTRALCGRLNIPIIVERADVAGCAAPSDQTSRKPPGSFATSSSTAWRGQSVPRILPSPIMQTTRWKPSCITFFEAPGWRDFAE